jgi:hypothetical protein
MMTAVAPAPRTVGDLGEPLSLIVMGLGAVTAGMIIGVAAALRASGRAAASRCRAPVDTR